MHFASLILLKLAHSSDSLAVRDDILAKTFFSGRTLGAVVEELGNRYVGTVNMGI